MTEVTLESAECTMPTSAEAIERYGLWIKRTAMRVCSLMPWADEKDLVQCGVLAVMESLQHFDPSRGTEFKKFACARIRGAMIDSMRHEGAHERRLTRSPADVIASAVAQSRYYDDPLEVLSRSADRELLLEAIKTLPERERLVIHLFYVEELNNREIAQALGVSEAYASKVRTSALARLGERLKSFYETGKEP